MGHNIDEYIDYPGYFARHIHKANLTGDQLVGLCPFHEDHASSFSVNMKTGQWKCYAGCGSGNVVSFHAKITQSTTREAYVELAREYHIPLKGATSRTSKSIPGSSSVKKTIPFEVLQQTLPLSGQLQDKLTRERGWSKSVCDEYQIGWHEKKRRFTIPIYDDDLEIVNIRLYQPGAGNNKIMSWGSGYGSSRLYPLGILDRARREERPVYLCEGEPDTLCGLSHGMLCITQTAGVSTWRASEWNALFKGLDVIVCYDNDDPGRMGVEKVTQYLPRLAKSVRVVKWPEWMGEKEDLTDWFVKHGKTVADLEAITQEIPQGKFRDHRDDEESLIERINQTHAVIMVGGKCVVLNEGINPAFNRPDITFSPPADFKTLYANQKMLTENAKGETKAIPLGKAWLEHPKRRQYNGLVFAPGRDVPGYYNLFRGLAYTPKKGKWQKFEDHIYNVISSGNQDVFAYICAWLAQLVQSPGANKAGTALVMRGEMGVGKGCFAENFGSLFGTHFLHITNGGQLTGRFNHHLKDALLVFVDEALWAGDKQAESVIKGIVTEKLIAIEPKGKDVFMVENHARLIIATNNDWAAPAAAEERRFFTIEVSNDRRQDREYFRAIYEEMENGGREAMLFDLLNLDISTVDFGRFPRTEALLDQILHTMSSTQKFWFEILRRGYLVDETDEQWSHNEGLVQTSKLYEEYIKFCENLGYRRPDADSVFTRKIKEWCTFYRERINMGTGGRTWHVRFPPLPECREHFEAKVDIKVDWAK